MSSIDPICGKPVVFGCLTGADSCSPIFSRSEVGDYCRGQLYSLPPGDRDTLMENYCLMNEQSEECKCMNRSQDDDYRRLKQGNPFSDACWYIPCSNRLQYFMTSEFDQPPKCPQNICQIVYNIAKDRDINIDHIENDINCDFSHGGVIPKSPTIPTWIYAAALVIILAFISVFALK